MFCFFVYRRFMPYQRDYCLDSLCSNPANVYILLFKLFCFSKVEQGVVFIGGKKIVIIQHRRFSLMISSHSYQLPGVAPEEAVAKPDAFYRAIFRALQPVPILPAFLKPADRHTS